jgi:hypothetical protein
MDQSLAREVRHSEAQDVQNAAGQVMSGLVHVENTKMPSMPQVREAVGPLPESKHDSQRNTSILSIPSPDEIHATKLFAAADQPRIAHLQSTATNGRSQDVDIIDLCSDDGDVVSANSFQSKIEQTPDFEEILPPPRSNILDSEEDILRWPTRKRKYEVIQIDSDDEDEVLREIDGDAWKRASLRQSQVKKSGSAE